MVLWLANQGWIANEDDAFDEVRLKLADLGHDPAAFGLETLDSSYGPLGRTIEATYLRLESDGPPVHVKAVRRLAFQDWQIVELSVGEPLSPR